MKMPAWKETLQATVVIERLMDFENLEGKNQRGSARYMHPEKDRWS